MRDNIDLANLPALQGIKLSVPIPPMTDATVSVHNADFNKDGFSDLAMGIPNAGTNETGVVFVFYNKDGYLNTTNPDTIILGSMPGAHAGFSLTSGNFKGNGGYPALVVGASEASPNGKTKAGEVYVIDNINGIFPREIDLSNSTLKYVSRFFGSQENAQAGYSITSVDFNKDGYFDLVVGAPGASSNWREEAGTVSIVYGSADGFPHTADLFNLTFPQGSVILGAKKGDLTGYALHTLYFNGDFFPDLAIGAPAINTIAPGKVCMLYGSNFAFSELDLSLLAPSQGFWVLGSKTDDKTGYSITSGDMNKDGRSDLIIAAPGASPDDIDEAGMVYVIYNQDCNLNDVYLKHFAPAEGFRIKGVIARAFSGSSLSYGNLNDEEGTLFIGAPGISPKGREEAGATYVVYNQKDPCDMSLAIPLNNGFEILGSEEKAKIGNSLTSADNFDFNNDGIVDLFIITQHLDAFVIYGRKTIAGSSEDNETIFPTKKLEDIDGGSNQNHPVSYELSSEPVYVNLATGIGHGGYAEYDTLKNVRYIIGSDFDDELKGNADNNIIEGGCGHDILWGKLGTDIFNITNCPKSSNIIQDFEIDKKEKIDLSQFPKINWDNLQIAGTSEETQITLPNDVKVTLSNIPPNDLTSEYFIFYDNRNTEETSNDWWKFIPIASLCLSVATLLGIALYKYCKYSKICCFANAAAVVTIESASLLTGDTTQTNIDPVPV